MRSYDKTSYRILKRGLLPFYWRVRHLTATTFYGHLELIATTSHEHHWQLGCLFNSMFRLITEITSKLRVMILRGRNLSVPSITSGFPWWRSSQRYGKRVHMMTSSNGNIFRVTGHLCGEFTGPRWIPRTKARVWCFLWSAPAKTVE